MTTLSRDAVPIGDDTEPVGEPRVDVEIGYEEEEDLESEIPTVETNPKDPMRKAQQEREDCGHAVYRHWCAVCVKGRCVEKHIQVEPLKEEERERTKLPLVSFDYVFSNQDNADTFSILIRRDDGHGRTRVTRCERKDSIPYLSPFLVDWRILLVDKNEPNVKVFRESRSHLMVRKTKKQDRNPEDLISKERGTEVKIKDDVLFLNWIPHFAGQFLNKPIIGWRKPKVQFGKKI